MRRVFEAAFDALLAGLTVLIFRLWLGDSTALWTVLAFILYHQLRLSAQVARG